MEKRLNVELHAHTDASLSDGAMTYKEAINTAIERGLSALAITNHGTAADMIDALIYAESKNFHLIVGVEAYIAKSENLYDGIEDKEASKEKTVRQHLLILVKDVIGYQAYCQFISETNRNIDDSGRPIGTVEMLEKFFGPGTPGHGHVVCSSACFAGPIANPLLFNARIDKEITKIENRIKKSEMALGDAYITAKSKVASVEAKIDILIAEIEKLTPTSKQKFTELKKQIKTETDENKKEKLQLMLDGKIHETDEAKKRIGEIKEQVKELKASIKDEKKILTASKNKVGTIEANQEIIRVLDSRHKTEAEMFKEACDVAKRYVSIFGEDFYGEIQYHGWESEKYVYPKVLKVCNELGIKLIATNDVHMSKKYDARRRELSINVGGISKGMAYRKLEDGDYELFIKTAEEKLEALSQIVNYEDALKAIVMAGDVAMQCTFDLEQIKTLGKHYPSFVDAGDRLKELATDGYTKAYLENGKFVEIKSDMAGIKARYGDKWNGDLQARFDYELGVIENMGFSSYFIYIADVINKCKALYGTPIGPGRGSGAGSIVCFLTGITELEPISLNLLFERFLNPERVSMPDIDTDFSKEARAYAIKYVTEFYGEKKVAGILTKAKMGPKNALTYAPKLYAKCNGLDSKAYSNEGAALRGVVGDSKTLAEMEGVVSEKFAGNEVALAIFEDAKRLEGLTTSYGQHAAGIISIMDQDVEDFIPLMEASDDEGNKKMVIQADMVAAEAKLGFIKFDFLGLKNLNIITACQRMIQNRHGQFINTYTLGYDDPEVYKQIFQKGNTNFVFQFESAGMKKMLKELKPSSFEDLVLAVSVYRPGPMEFIPDIIRCKETGEDSEIVKRMPILRDCLAETYGFPVYQEQVMQIMTLAAGFSMGKADNVRRFMSKKKEEKLAEVRPEFVKGCLEVNGISEVDSNWLFDQLMPFAKYGFNKSHGAAYSYVSYLTAWMKHYYPAEYLCSAMLEQGDKTLQFLSDCKGLNIDVLPASVNSSTVNYTVESEGMIRIGLQAIKGLKNEASKIVEARKDGVFTSFKNFLERTNLKANSLEAVILSGACDEFVSNREVANTFAASYMEAYGEFQKASEMIRALDEEAKAEVSDEKTLTRKYATWNKKLENATEIISHDMPKVFDISMKVKTAYETKYLGMWMSGSPMDDYNLEDARYKSIADVKPDESFMTIGIVSEYRKTRTKNGDDMCFFTLLDKDSESVPVVVFPKAFENCPEIDDNMIIEITGFLGERDGEPQIEATCITTPETEAGTLLIDCQDVDLFVNVIISLIDEYRSESGVLCLLTGAVVGEMREVAFRVSKDLFEVLYTKGINCVMQ